MSDSDVTGATPAGSPSGSRPLDSEDELTGNGTTHAENIAGGDAATKAGSGEIDDADSSPEELDR
jgi:hypothetical protein